MLLGGWVRAEFQCSVSWTAHRLLGHGEDDLVRPAVQAAPPLIVCRVAPIPACVEVAEDYGDPTAEFQYIQIEDITVGRSAHRPLRGGIEIAVAEGVSLGDFAPLPPLLGQ